MGVWVLPHTRHVGSSAIKAAVVAVAQGELESIQDFDKGLLAKGEIA